METRTLGSQGLTVSAQGLGCMGMSQSYGEPDEAGSIATLHRALELGVTFWDTANVYGATGPGGFGANETLLARCWPSTVRRSRSPPRWGSRASTRPPTPDRQRFTLSATPDEVRRRCDESLARLGTDRIDLYYLHRVDPDTPIEESIGAMAELVTAGKVRHVGVSEVTADELERAHATHPITALQSEWSLWTRGLEADVVPTARRLGVGLVPFSPLGRGFLTGALAGHTFADGDVRGHAGALHRRQPHRQRGPRRRGGRGGAGARRAARARSRSPGCSSRGRTSYRSPAPSGSPTSSRTSARSTYSLTDDDVARLGSLTAQVAGGRS